MSLSQKLMVRPDRRRVVPPRFSWLDQRLVREGHLRTLSLAAQSLYLFLTVVGDANGVSWYSTRRIVLEIGLGQDELEAARAELIRAELIGFNEGVYQVLEVPHRVVSAPVTEQCGVQEQPATAQQIAAIAASFRARQG
jgi:hypothetical protein